VYFVAVGGTRAPNELGSYRWKFGNDVVIWKRKDDQFNRFRGAAGEPDEKNRARGTVEEFFT